MTPRPRKPGNKGLPDNLYPRKDKRSGKVYYSYRDPVTRQEYGLGSDKAEAIRQARAANIEAIAVRPSLVDRIKGSAYLLSDWLVEYRRIIQEERDLSPATVRTLLMRVNTIDGWLGDKPIQSITTLDFTERFKEMTQAGKVQMVRALRSASTDIFREAIAAGRCKENPLLVTKAPRIKIKRERLRLDQWQAIYECAEQAWLKRAMELAVLTAQRRDDIARMKFADIKEGFLHVHQSKTGRRLRISEQLTLTSLGLTLSAVIKKCRDDIASPYLVHHQKNTGVAKRGQGIMLDTLSKAFADARDEAVRRGMITVTDRPPTFHEMRSLGARLHAQENRDPQSLLGHSNPATTAIYKDTRGWEWLEISA